MPEQICPSCSSATTAAEGHSALCPSCGFSFSGPDGDSFADLPCDADFLVSEIREAFDSVDENRESVGAAGVGASELTTSARLGDFEILRPIGHGGMGIVYRARQLSLGREVALKVLPAIARYRRTAVRRFRTEARAIARVNHPNVVPVYAEGEQDGHLYFAMELVNGVGLDWAIRKQPELLSSRNGLAALSARNGQRQAAPEGPLNGKALTSAGLWSLQDYRHIAMMLACVADGLSHAHDSGVIHRDIKPHNILLGTDGRLRITDFGLAHLATEPHVTTSGEIMGTPAYLSPEQARGDNRKITPHTDIYGLGATLYELLTGRPPFAGKSRDQVLRAICDSDPIDPRKINPQVPRDLETICLRAIEKSPGRRHATAAELAEDLRRFSQGRAILSRPRSLFDRACRTIARHRSRAAVLAVTLTVLALAGGLLVTVAAFRHREANQLLKNAYEQLAYRDYRSPEALTNLEQAEALDADPIRLGVVRALADLGADRAGDAIPRLEAVLALDPQRREAQYLLAWAQWRIQAYEQSRRTLDQADQAGGPSTPPEWFFRGLAAHFDRPDLAIQSYRQANDLRAQDDEFYPQAVLHWARCCNQQMYATRSVRTFTAAHDTLKQLIDHRHYGAYAYYLLSITHRLAGDIYGEQGDTDRQTEHYHEALHWSREGRATDPADDRPVTAEAECLERLGQYDEALAARTQAIDLPATPRQQCEGYHYRWRLHYWKGDLEDALQDIRAHGACMPENMHYAHVYPALVYAELGNITAAVSEAWLLVNHAPEDPQAVLWAATLLRLLNRPADADDLLEQRVADVVFSEGLVPPQTEAWVEALYYYSKNGQGLDALLEQAQRFEAPQKLRAEALFHAGVLALSRGDREQASRFFHDAYYSFDGELRYTFHAKILYEKMLANPGWPAWITSIDGSGD